MLSRKRGLKVDRRFTLAAAFLVVISLRLFTSLATADILFEDIYYWGEGGADLAENHTKALVKIQETVYDNDQGTAVLQRALNEGWVDGGGSLDQTIDKINLYVYSITNLGAGDIGGVTGSGITTFNIMSSYRGNFSQFAPTAAIDNWDVVDVDGEPNMEWHINANSDNNVGDGVGIALGFSHSGFMIAVPDGTSHGTKVSALIHSWSGEQPNGKPVQSDLFGLVSAPIPEPSAWALVGIGSIAMFAFRRNRL